MYIYIYYGMGRRWKQMEMTPKACCFCNLASKEYQTYGGRSTRIEGIVWEIFKASKIWTQTCGWGRTVQQGPSQWEGERLAITVILVGTNGQTMVWDCRFWFWGIPYVNLHKHNWLVVWNIPWTLRLWRFLALPASLRNGLPPLLGMGNSHQPLPMNMGMGWRTELPHGGRYVPLLEEVRSNGFPSFTCTWAINWHGDAWALYRAVGCG